MREIIEEYSGIITGGLAMAAVIGMAVQFALGGEGLHDIILNFSQGIC